MRLEQDVVNQLRILASLALERRVSSVEPIAEVNEELVLKLNELLSKETKP